MAQLYPNPIQYEIAGNDSRIILSVSQIKNVIFYQKWTKLYFLIILKSPSFCSFFENKIF